MDTPPLPPGAVALEEMPPLPPGAQFVSTHGGAAPGMAAPKAPVAPPSKKSRSDISELLSAGGFGTALGAVAPELLTLGGGAAAAFPLTAPAAPFLFGLGTAARGARVASGLAGGLAGITGEIGAKGTEAMGGGDLAQEAARFVAGGVGPESVSLIGKVLKGVIGKLAGAPEAAIAAEVGKQIAGMATGGKKEVTLSDLQKQHIEQIVKDLRAGTDPKAVAEKAFGTLETAAKGITGDAEAMGTALSKSAERQAQQARAGAEQEVARIRVDSHQKAAAIRDQAKAEADAVRETNATEASSILADAEKEAKRIFSDSERRIRKMQDARVKSRDIASGELERAGQAKRSVGTDREHSETGTTLRDQIATRKTDLTQARKDQYKADESTLRSEVADKEGAGQYLENTQKYQNIIESLDTELSGSPVKHTDPKIVQQLERLKKALAPQLVGKGEVPPAPISFQAADEIRRSLGDAAFGKPATGYEAIGQNLARDYWKKLSVMLGEFAPQSKNMIEKYELAGKELDPFKSGRGARATALDRYNPEAYVTDAKELPTTYFRSRQGVNDLLELTGGDNHLVREQAGNFAAREIRDLDAKGIKAWANKNSDWLTHPEMRGVKEDVEYAAKQLEQGERVSSKSTKAIQKLLQMEPGIASGAERAAKGVIDPAQRAADTLEKRGETAAERAVRGGERSAVGTLRAAESAAKSATDKGEKTAGGLLSDAEKLSAKLTNEAKARVQDILGDAAPERRIQELILSKDRNTWKEIGPIIVKDKEGKDAFVQAVRNVIADKAEKSPGAVGDLFRVDILPYIEGSGLLSPAGLKALQSQVAQIDKQISGPDKVNRLAKVIVQGLGGSVAGNVADRVFNPAQAIGGMMGM